MMKSIKNIWRKLSGKGYYIALILCAVAIGISGYLYYRSVSTPEPSLQALPTESTDVPVLSPDSDPDDETVLQQPEQTALPLKGQTVMSHSVDRLSYDPTTRDWRTHAGIDIAAEAGAAVGAAADGVVYTTYDDDLLGTTVVIRHDGGYVTTYASLHPETLVEVGDSVNAGDVIGYVGSTGTSTGPHLHFAIYYNGNSVNPASYVNF